MGFAALNRILQSSFNPSPTLIRHKPRRLHDRRPALDVGAHLRGEIRRRLIVRLVADAGELLRHIQRRERIADREVQLWSLRGGFDF
jgi:hypothetical protein